MDDEETIRVERGDPARRCGPYELVRELGRGAMGTVWEGRHAALGRRVAVKIIHGEFMKNPELLARFHREGKAAALLEHPHVAQVFDVGQDDQRAWIVMELLEGEDLKTVVDREGGLDVTRAVDIFLPVLAGVGAAHAANVTHRDLKPANLFLARDRTGAVVPKVVDFGLSKIRADESGEEMDLTRPDTALGTLYYMPVEQVLASRDAGPASDQYALGVSLYRCVTGKLPYEGRNNSRTFAAISKGVCPRPSELVPTIPAALDAVILRAMHREVAGRFPSVQAFGAALLPFASPAAQARWAGTFGVNAAPVTAVTDRPPRAKLTALQWVVIVAGALVLMVGGALALWLTMR